MFPNVRLLIGTLFIAVLVLSCEFGVFAALRVNREPLNRLTAESTPLQLAAGHNAPAAVAMSWTAPRETHAAAADAAAPDIATEVAKVAAPTKPVIETPAPQANEATAAIPQPAPAAAAIPQDAAPPAQPAASVAPAQGAPAAAANAPAQALPAQPTPDQQAHVSGAKANEPASDAPVAAAPPAAAAPALAALPEEITGSVPNAETPAPPAPEATKPAAETAAKAAHKPAKKAGKAARKPAQVHTVKKRIVRARAPAAASAAQPANTFNNPVFASAPQLQRPAKKRAGTKKAATNTGFGTPFGEQFGTH